MYGRGPKLGSRRNDCYNPANRSTGFALRSGFHMRADRHGPLLGTAVRTRERSMPVNPVSCGWQDSRAQPTDTAGAHFGCWGEDGGRFRRASGDFGPDAT